MQQGNFGGGYPQQQGGYPPPPPSQGYGGGYPQQGGGYPPPSPSQGNYGGYPPSQGGFQPIEPQGGYGGGGYPSMPQDGGYPYYDDQQFGGPSPQNFGQHKLIRKFEPMAAEVYIDEDGEEIIEEEFEPLDLEAYMTKADKNLEKLKKRRASMFPLEEYAPKSDVKIQGFAKPEDSKMGAPRLTNEVVVEQMSEAQELAIKQLEAKANIALPIELPSRLPPVVDNKKLVSEDLTTENTKQDEMQSMSGVTLPENEAPKIAESEVISQKHIQVIDKVATDEYVVIPPPDVTVSYEDSGAEESDTPVDLYKTFRGFIPKSRYSN